MRTAFYYLGFVIFGLILFFTLGDSLFNRERLNSLGFWSWILAVGLMIADIVLPIPNTAIITVMGQTYGPVLGGVIGIAGSFAAGVIAYGLTRMLGRGFAEWLLGDELASAERFFSTSGSFAVACSRWLPLLPEAISCMAGLARMPFGKYCVALLCGCVPMIFAYAALAAMSDIEFIPLLISIILPIPIWWVAGRLLHRRATKI